MGSPHGMIAGHAGEFSRIGNEGHRIHTRNVAILLGHQADTLADSQPVGDGVHTENGRMTRVGLDETQPRFQESCFSGSVGPQKPDGALRYLQCQAREGRLGSVLGRDESGFGKVAGVYRRVIAVSASA